MEKLNLFLAKKREIYLFFTICIVAAVAAAMTNLSGGMFSYSDCASADDELVAQTEQHVTASLGDNLETYAGIFSTTVTNSVNPTATLTILSVLGVMEKADQYTPNATWLLKCEDFLNDVPFVRTAKNLPIANPFALVLLTILTLVLYAIRSFKPSKAVSQATIDQLEQWGGLIVTVCLALMPIATSRVVEASDGTVKAASVVAAAADGKIYVTGWTFFVTLIVGIAVAVISGLTYWAISQCVGAVEILAAAIPLKGTNLIVEIVKAILHIILVILQLISPLISVIFSLILMVIGMFMARRLSILATYYNYIYLKPLWKMIFHKNDKYPLIHKKYAKKKKLCTDGVTVAIPAFSMNRIQGMKKRRMIWLVVDNDVPKLIRIRRFRSPEAILISDLTHKEIYLEKTIRFTRVRTEDSCVEIIFSNVYSNQWNELLDLLKMRDYVVVKERIKAEKAEQKAQKAARRLEEKQKRMDLLEEKIFNRIEEKQVEAVIDAEAVELSSEVIE